MPVSSSLSTSSITRKPPLDTTPADIALLVVVDVDALADDDADGEGVDDDDDDDEEEDGGGGRVMAGEARPLGAAVRAGAACTTTVPTLAGAPLAPLVGIGATVTHQSYPFVANRQYLNT